MRQTIAQRVVALDCPEAVALAEALDAEREIR
jgi:hypothetical protein